MSALDWCWREFGELGVAELYAALRLRAAVFVVEQSCAFQDCDDADAGARHLLGWRRGELLAYLRLHPPGVKAAEPVLSRVVTAPAVRREGLGRELVALGLDGAQEHFPGQAVRIGAQARLRRFYEGFGFAVSSGAYLEDGIVHVEMLRPPAPG